MSKKYKPVIAIESMSVDHGNGYPKIHIDAVMLYGDHAEQDGTRRARPSGRRVLEDWASVQGSRMQGTGQAGEAEYVEAQMSVMWRIKRANWRLYRYEEEAVRDPRPAVGLVKSFAACMAIIALRAFAFVVWIVREVIYG